MRSQQTAITGYSARSRQWDFTGRLQIAAVPVDIESCVVTQKQPMWLFVVGGRRLLCRRPVEVVIREDDGAVLAECSRLHVFAAGDTYEEAMASLQSQVVHFFDEYSALSDEDVIGRAAEIRTLYQDHFEEVGQPEAV